MSRLVIVGLGPGPWERIPAATRELLVDPAFEVIVRTLLHPAAVQLADMREVVSCDDVYDDGSTFEDVYEAIVGRVLAVARSGPTLYAVPGSPHIGELAVSRMIRAATSEGIPTEVHPAESFLDVVLRAVDYDPLDRGLRIINGHNLPSPLLIDGPTVIAHLDVPMVLSDVVAAVGRVVPEATDVTIVIDGGDDQARVIVTSLDEVSPSFAGVRTSMFLDPGPGGLPGVIATMWRLRHQCPWDQQQTHESLIKNLVEECYELIEALINNDDGTRYGAVEDELGDVLLQILFHASIARQAGAFDIEDVAENLRQKLVRRHPHVFGDIDIGTAEEVKANWETIKDGERGQPRDSALEGVPIGMPALERAAKLQRKAAGVGFDWPELAGVIDKVREELLELEAVAHDPEKAPAEVGDLLFSAVNLARWLDVDPEVALRGAIARFIERFQLMELEGPLSGLTLDQLDQRWERAKAQLPE